MITKFGENSDDKWYELDGKRIPTNEETIMHLWNQWIMIGGGDAGRTKENGYTVYTSIKPLNLN